MAARRKNATRESTATLKVVFSFLIKVSIIIRPVGLAERAQEEPLSNKGREDNAGDHHQDDPHTGNQPMQEDESGF